MDEDYYRRTKPKPPFTGRIKKQLRKKNVIFTVVILVPVVAFMTFSNKGFLKRLSLESEKKAMLARLELAKAEQRMLQDQSKALDNDPKAIERVAREKYGMIKEGETVYKVRKEK